MTENKREPITKDQARDTGMAMVLICLLLGLLGKMDVFYPVALGLLVVTMTWATAFKPVAVVWLGFSHILGTISSKILLSIVFFLLVVPVGGIRRVLGHDSLNLKGFKKGQESVFVQRDHQYQPSDIETPY